MGNIPLTREQIKESPLGFISSGSFPNRRTRRYGFNYIPNSSKLGRGSLNNPTVIRTNKFFKAKPFLYDYQKVKLEEAV
jgi:hypothetical protein